MVDPNSVSEIPCMDNWIEPNLANELVNGLLAPWGAERDGETGRGVELLERPVDDRTHSRCRVVAENQLFWLAVDEAVACSNAAKVLDQPSSVTANLSR
jgi:hypothetical protein